MTLPDLAQTAVCAKIVFLVQEMHRTSSVPKHAGRTTPELAAPTLALGHRLHHPFRRGWRKLNPHANLLDQSQRALQDLLFLHQVSNPFKQVAPAADCLMCRSTPKMQGSQFCGESCKKNAHTQAPLLLEVYNTDPKFSDIAKQFRSTWKDEGQIPPVIRLYKIVNSQKVEDAYEDYKKSVERNGKFATRGMAPGNENRRWHGTVRKCNIGDSPANLMPCNFQDCFLCSILHTSYDVKRSTLGWFGKGIYSTATSSGSNEYVGRTPPGSNCRAMFLNRVVVGNAYILKQQTESLKGPPRGYDSVIANADQSQGLAYDELVVYKNEAIRPSWLVIYG
ncbi:hypothetical protein FRB90_007797 [Tulasnella sp. 427]|nr:hypothetical protein FRB90_007797 [Tulasnella sp. 427]